MRFIVGILVSVFIITYSICALSFTSFDGIEPKIPKSGERFRATSTWVATEKILWFVATESGMRGWNRRLFISIVWNESRGRSKSIGDYGCAKGLTQIHVGGIGFKGGKQINCTNDARNVLPTELVYNSSDDYMEPFLNLRSGAFLFARKTANAGGSPFDGLSLYAGCRIGSQCHKDLLGKHLHWLQSGLLKRIIVMEEAEKRNEEFMAALRGFVIRAIDKTNHLLQCHVVVLLPYPRRWEVCDGHCQAPEALVGYFPGPLQKGRGEDRGTHRSLQLLPVR